MNPNNYVHKWGDSIFLADPEGDAGGGNTVAAPQGDAGTEGAGGNGGEPLSREARGFITDTVKRAINGSGFVTSDQLGQQFNTFGEKITNSISALMPEQFGGGGGQAPASEVAPAAAPGAIPTGTVGTVPAASQEPKPKKHETDMEVRMRRLESQLTLEREGRSKLEEQLEKERSSVSLEKRNSGILSAATRAGARDPQEVLLLTQQDLVQDDEKGWLYEVEGEFGKEFLTPDKYIPKFLAKKSHLRKTPVREGSNAGGGTDTGLPSDGNVETVDGRVVNEESLRDSVWYNKNRTAIGKVLSARMVKHQRQNPTQIMSV